jgi:hypothetical protein
MKVVRLHPRGLSFHTVTVTKTVHPETKEEVVNQTETQYGFSAAGGGVNLFAFNDITDEQFRALSRTGEAVIEP